MKLQPQDPFNILVVDNLLNHFELQSSYMEQTLDGSWNKLCPDGTLGLNTEATSPFVHFEKLG